MSMSPEDAAQLAVEYTKKYGAVGDGMVSGSESMDIELYEGALTKSEVSCSTGIGIRLLKDGCPGYSSTKKLSKSSIEQMVKDALALASLTDPLDIDLAQPKKLPDIDLKKWNPELEKISMSEMKHFALSMEQSARDHDTRVENIPHLGMGKQSGWSYVFNTEGCGFASRANSTSAYTGVVCSEKGQKKSGGYGMGARDFSALNATDIGKTAVERSTELLGASALTEGSLPIIISNRISASLIGMFLSVFSADTIQKGQSKLEGKLDSLIAVPSLTMTSLPHLPGEPGSRLYDLEGVLSGNLSIVEDGMFKNVLHNLETSKKDGVASNGHASRGLQGKVGIGFSNLHISRGTSSLKELLNVYPEVLYVTKLEGGSACSAVSGEICIGIQGILYKKGLPVRPIDACTMSTNFFDVLKNIQGLSCDYSETFSSLKVPDILITGSSLSS